MLIWIILLVVVVVASVAAAIAAWQANQRRLEVLVRADARGAAASAPVVLVDPTAGASARVGLWAEKNLPEALVAEEQNEKLIQAGFDSPSAPAIFALIRVSFAIACPLLVLAFGPRDSFNMLVVTVVIGVAFGVIGPPGFLDTLRRRRQDRIRKSIPDCLDLLLVCVEAGVSLDAAILRVGREMQTLHPELSAELLIMNRKMNAGMRREEALHGLHRRTGVEELRSLASSMIQSERWGTSIGKVLRVASETMRRKRRQVAEKKAAQASVKMIIPLALFILPALFAIVGGPAILGLGPVLNALGG